MDDLMKVLGLLAVGFAMFYVDVLILNHIWNLTVVPLGAPNLNWKQMYGVCLFVNGVSFSWTQPPSDIDDKIVYDLKRMFYRTFGLLFSWLLAHIFFG